MSNIEGKHLAYLRIGYFVELDTHMTTAENRTLHHWTFPVGPARRTRLWQAGIGYSTTAHSDGFQGPV